MQRLLAGGQLFAAAGISQGCRVRCLDLSRAPFLGENGIDFVPGSITDQCALDAAVDGVDAVVHLACNVIPKTSNADPCLDIETNICGSVRLLDACVRHGVRRFVFISSGGTVYGIPRQIPIPETHPNNPDCSYGITKLSIEKYVGMYGRERGLSTCTLRLANPYGEYQRVKSAQGAVAVFCYKAITGEPIEIWGDGNVVRDFVYVGDAVNAIVKALVRDDVSGEINIGSGKGTSMNELLDMIDGIVGRRTIRKYMPGRVFDVPANVLDISKARELLGWEPAVMLPEGIKKTISWISRDGVV